MNDAERKEFRKKLGNQFDHLPNEDGLEDGDVAEMPGTETVLGTVPGEPLRLDSEVESSSDSDVSAHPSLFSSQTEVRHSTIPVGTSTLEQEIANNADMGELPDLGIGGEVSPATTPVEHPSPPSIEEKVEEFIKGGAPKRELGQEHESIERAVEAEASLKPAPEVGGQDESNDAAHEKHEIKEDPTHSHFGEVIMAQKKGGEEKPPPDGAEFGARIAAARRELMEERKE